MIKRYLVSLSDGHESKNNEGWNGPPKEGIVMEPYLVRPYLLPEEMQKMKGTSDCMLQKESTYLENYRLLTC